MKRVAAFPCNDKFPARNAFIASPTDSNWEKIGPPKYVAFITNTLEKFYTFETTTSINWLEIWLK